MKSPIRYADNHEFCIGEIELALSSTKRFVNCHTNKYPVYEFWKCMQENPKRINEIIHSDSFKSFNNLRSFNILQENWLSYNDPYMRAALFLFLNWTSDSGLISSGKFQKLSSNPLRSKKVTNFKPRNFHLSLVEPSVSIFDSIESKPSDQFILAPMGRFTYNLFDDGKQIGIEQTHLNHTEFYSFIEGIPHKWILIYKNHKSVHNMYKKFNVIKIDRIGNVTNQNNCEDLIVTNF